MLNKYLAGWYRTMRYAAPKNMESVQTVYRELGHASELGHSSKLGHARAADQEAVDGRPDPALARYRSIFKTIYNLPPDQRSELQLPRDGVGDIYHRRYRISMTAEISATELMQKIQTDIDHFCDPHLAKIKKLHQRSSAMTVGDDFLIAITGPWNGPVRTVSVDDTSFVFATRHGHLEAGLIRFTVESNLTNPTNPTGPASAADSPDSPDSLNSPLSPISSARSVPLTFGIESWATSGGWLVWFTYSVIGITRKMQTKMWRYFCLKVVKESRGVATTPLDVQTRKIKIDTNKESNNADR